MRWLIVALCLGWSAFQLYIAYVPFDQFLARVFHLTFALLLAFLCYPAYREPDGRLAKLLDRLSGGPRLGSYISGGITKRSSCVRACRFSVTSGSVSSPSSCCSKPPGARLGRRSRSWRSCSSAIASSAP